MRLWNLSFGTMLRGRPSAIATHFDQEAVPEHVVALTDRTLRNVSAIVRSTITTLVDVNNVYAWCEANDGNPERISSWDGCIAPWPVCWLEWSDRRLNRLAGMLVLTTPRKDDDEGVAEFLSINAVDTADAAWLMHIAGPFLLHSDGALVLGPVHSMALALDADGRPTGGQTLDHPLALAWELEHGPLAIPPETVMYLARWCRRIALATFRFANCRNVEAIEMLPTRQQRRAAERRGEPTHRYYVLAIDPNAQRRISPKGECVPTTTRLHLCRGHFATYTEEAPLFGKWTGRFWIPQHVRGNPDAGVVGKDYAVKAPTNG